MARPYERGETAAIPHAAQRAAQGPQSPVQRRLDDDIEVRERVDAVDADRWVREAREGSVAAFERLYRGYVDRVYGVCLRMTANRSDAEDCVQNTFVNAWRELGQFHGHSDFGTWLHRIAVNEVLMARRRSRPAASLDESEPPRTTHGPDVALDLEAAIAELPEQARYVFVLRAVYGHSHDEIAQMLEIAPGTARAHFFNARRILMRALKLEDDDESAG
jgi:RNA polymerase sigma-70 factor (ECF subfamily)